MKSIKELEKMNQQKLNSLSPENKINAQTELRTAIKRHFRNPMATYENCHFNMSYEQYKQLEQVFAPIRFSKKQN